MNSISWMIYAADVCDGFDFVLGFAAIGTFIVSLGGAVIYLASRAEDDPEVTIYQPGPPSPDGRKG